MASEKLIVQLEADTAKLDSALDSSTHKLDDLDDATNKSDDSLNNFSTSAKSAAGFVAGFAAAALAGATALSTFIVMAGKNQRELEILSRQAKLTTEEFSALSFATKQYGIDADQIADITKDLSDKLGEFGRVGTGPFQDFADVVGMSKQQAQELAIELQDLSGDQVIGELVSRMEEAGASGNEMTFVLESMGNDLSRLIPLFSDNSAELIKLKGQYKDATDQMELTKEEITALTDLATDFDTLTTSMGKAGDKIAAELAPRVSRFFNGILEVVPNATKAIVEFLDTFVSAEESKGGRVYTGTIDRGQGNVAEAVEVDQLFKPEVIEEVEELEVEALVRKEERLLELKNYYAAQEELLRQKTLDSKLRQEEKDARAAKRGLDREAREVSKQAKEKELIQSTYLSAAKSLNTDLLNDNKAIGAGLIVADTAVGITRAFKDLPYPAAIAASAAIAANGVVQLAALNSATRGGGGGSTSAPAAVPLESIEDDQSELLLSQSDTSGTNQSVIIRFEGSGDEITEAIAKNMQVLQRNGTLDA